MDTVNLPGFDREESAKFQEAAAKLDAFRESCAIAAMRRRIADRFAKVCAANGCPLAQGRDSMPADIAQASYSDDAVPEVTEAEEAAIVKDLADAA